MSVEMILNTVGGALVVAAYIALSLDVVKQKSYMYVVPNLIGAAILLYQAVVTVQPGFIVLEVVWLCMSLVLLYDVVTKEAKRG